MLHILYKREASLHQPSLRPCAPCHTPGAWDEIRLIKSVGTDSDDSEADCDRAEEAAPACDEDCASDEDDCENVPLDDPAAVPERLGRMLLQLPPRHPIDETGTEERSRAPPLTSDSLCVMVPPRRRERVSNDGGDGFDHCHGDVWFFVSQNPRADVSQCGRCPYGQTRVPMRRGADGGETDGIATKRPRPSSTATSSSKRSRVGVSGVLQECRECE